VLAIIFVAVKYFATPAHRELIDMVMSVVNSGNVAQLESISKTKVRGVLALLKHGELLVTQGEYGEPVRLYLASGIETYRDLRERHDVFLSAYMLDNHLFIPAVLRSEVLWQVDEETRVMRLDGMERLVAKLKQFFSSSNEYRPHLLDRTDDGSVGGSGASAAVDKAPTTPPGSTAGGRGAGRGGNGRGVGGGRGFAPYGGGTGRHGSFGAYGNGRYGGGSYDSGHGGYGGGYGGGRGYGYSSSRAQQVRLASAQASMNWANNEEYAELGNEEWTDPGHSSGGKVTPSLPAAPGLHKGPVRPVPFMATSTAASTGVLSAQAPEFDPTKLNPSAKPFAAQPPPPPPATTAAALGVDVTSSFRYANARGPGGGSAALKSLAAAALSGGSADESVWLRPTSSSSSNGTARAGYDFWSDAGSNSFFNSPPANSLNGSRLEMNAASDTALNLSLGELNISARPYDPPSSGRAHNAVRSL
jgi:hypothetical protein